MTAPMSPTGEQRQGRPSAMCKTAEQLLDEGKAMAKSGRFVVILHPSQVPMAVYLQQPYLLCGRVPIKAPCLGSRQPTESGAKVVGMELFDEQTIDGMQVTPLPPVPQEPGRWPIGTLVEKTKGASWHGRIVGYYATSLTPEGYCVESEREPGSVQIYPRTALIEAKP